MNKTIEIIRGYATDTQSLLDTAMMLNGPWGSGKTYFVKKILIPKLWDKEDSTLEKIWSFMRRCLLVNIFMIILMMVWVLLRRCCIVILIVEVVKKGWSYIRERLSNSMFISELRRKCDLRIINKDETKPESNPVRIKSTYISLHGVKSINEIRDRIIFSYLGSETKTKDEGFSSAFEQVKKTNYGLTGNIARDFVLVSGGFMKDFIVAMDIKNRLLIVDDLERVSDELSMEEVFGYFNNHFIEKHKQKVLFVCNEKEAEHKKDYKKIKEKTISWTIEYAPEFEDCFNSIIEKESLEHHNQFLENEEENKAIIVSLFKTTKIRNLRTVIKIIEVFNKIMIENAQELDNALLLRLYGMVMMLVNETLSDNTNYKNVQFLEAVKENKDLPLLLITRNDEDSEIFNEMIRKYFWGISFKWLYVPSVHNFIDTYHYDKSSISAELEALTKPVTPSSQALNKFIGRDYLETEDDVRQVLIELEDHIEKDRYDIRDLHEIYINLQDSYLSEVYKTNVEVLKNLIFSKAKQIINGCNSIYEMKERYHFLESGNQFNSEFSERLKPTYDERKAHLLETYVQESLKQFLESPALGSPFLEQMFNSEMFFTSITQCGFVDYICKMNTPKLARFNTALEVELQRHNNVINLKPEEKESVRAIIDGLKENVSNDRHHKDKQERLIATLTLFLDGGRGLPTQAETQINEVKSVDDKSDSKSRKDSDKDHGNP